MLRRDSMYFIEDSDSLHRITLGEDFAGTNEFFLRLGGIDKLSPTVYFVESGCRSRSRHEARKAPVGGSAGSRRDGGRIAAGGDVRGPR